MSVPRAGSRLVLFGDERGVIVSFVIRTIAVFAFLGIVAYDAGQVVVAQVKAENIAQAAAQAGADMYHSTKNTGQARAAADAALKEQDPTAIITAFNIQSDGTVSVTVQRTAHTLVVEHVPPLRHFGIQSATEHAVHTF
jgi:Flp pilus assembly protein TadG